MLSTKKEERKRLNEKIRREGTRLKKTLGPSTMDQHDIVNFLVIFIAGKSSGPIQPGVRRVFTFFG